MIVRYLLDGGVRQFCKGWTQELIVISKKGKYFRCWRTFSLFVDLQKIGSHNICCTKDNYWKVVTMTMGTVNDSVGKDESVEMLPSSGNSSIYKILVLGDQSKHFTILCFSKL